MSVTISGEQPPKISCHAHLSHDGNFVITLIAATLLAFCLCSLSDYAYANSQTTQQTRDLSALVLVKKGGVRIQLGPKLAR